MHPENTSTPRTGVSRAVLLAGAPLLVPQGWWVRRRTPRLPDADSPTGVVDPAGPAEPLRLAVVGDSVAAGVGVDDHADTLAGRCCAAIAERTGRPAAWQVIARSGADSDDVADLLVGRSLASVTAAVVSVGVNDTKNLRSDGAWRAGLTRLLHTLGAAAPKATIVLLGIPPIQCFPALPAPLSVMLGARARRLDAIGRRVALTNPRVHRVEVTPQLVGRVPNPFASDGFHPGAELHAVLAERAAEVILRAGGGCAGRPQN